MLAIVREGGREGGRERKTKFGLGKRIYMKCYYSNIESRSLPLSLPSSFVHYLSMFPLFSHADIKTSSENGQFSDAEITIIDKTHSRSKCEEKPLLKSTSSEEEQPSTDSKVVGVEIYTVYCKCVLVLIAAGRDWECG